MLINSHWSMQPTKIINTDFKQTVEDQAKMIGKTTIPENFKFFYIKVFTKNACFGVIAL